MNSLMSTIKLNIEDNTNNIVSQIGKASQGVENSLASILLNAESNINNKTQQIVASELDNQRHFFAEANEQVQALLKSGNVNLINKIETVLSELKDCKTEYESVKVTQKELESMKSKVVDLEAQKVLNLAAIGQKDAQHEELMARYNKMKFTFEENNKTIEKLKSSNELAITGLESGKQKISSLEEKISFQEASYENKLLSQGEMIKTINNENNVLKNRLQKLEEEKKTFEENLYKKVDRIEELNMQVQNMNVEMVQLKARKLELEEENSHIKMNFQSDHNQQQKIENELKLQKQNIIQLTGKNQDLLTEKLELQDQVDNLTRIIKRGSEKARSPVPLNTPDKKKKYSNIMEQSTNIPKQNKNMMDPNKYSHVKKPAENGKTKTAIISKPSESSDIKKTSDIFDLSSSNSEFDLEYTSSSLVTNRPKVSNPKSIRSGDRDIPVKQKKKLIEDIDLTKAKPILKKRRIERI